MKWQKIDYTREKLSPFPNGIDHNNNYWQCKRNNANSHTIALFMAYQWTDVCQSHKSEYHFDLQLMQLISFYGYVKIY